MTISDVKEFCLHMAALGLDVWLDGGWGVDALLGRQTRAHGDLDIVVQEKDRCAMVTFLQSRGFRELARDDSRPWNFVMGNNTGNEIDLHVIVLDAEGNGLYGPPGCGEGMYPAQALQWQGSVAGLTVKCLSPRFQINSHTGYAFDDTDCQDVRALADKFGLDLPAVYKEYLRLQDK